MSITMQELAEIAGVSRATVDRVLNNRGNVSKETEERILSLAKSVGYRPNAAARALSSSSEIFKIGCILTYADKEFMALVKTGVKKAQEEFSMFGVKTIIYPIDRLDEEEQYQALEEMEKEGVHAIVLNPMNSVHIANKMKRLIQKGIKIVVITADIADVDYFAYVGIDHRRSGRVAANLIHLLKPNPTKAAAFIGTKQMRGHEQRMEGFSFAIAQKYRNIELVTVRETKDDEQIVFSQTKEVLETHSDVEFLYYVGGGVRGGVRALLESPKKDSVKIIAYDLYDDSKNYLLEDTVIPIAIFQHPQNQSYAAVKLMSEYLLYGKKPESQTNFTRAEIVVAESLNPCP